MTVHVSIAPEKLSLKSDDKYHYLRLTPDTLVVLTEEQADEISQILWNRHVKEEAA